MNWIIRLCPVKSCLVREKRWQYKNLTPKKLWGWTLTNGGPSLGTKIPITCDISCAMSKACFGKLWSKHLMEYYKAIEKKLAKKFSNMGKTLCYIKWIKEAYECHAWKPVGILATLIKLLLDFRLHSQVRADMTGVEASWPLSSSSRSKSQDWKHTKMLILYIVAGFSLFLDTLKMF